MHLLARLLAASILLLAAVAAQARVFEGTVTHVTDGDTLWVKAAGAHEAVSVRIQGIDAPEICQSFGVEARNALAARALHRSVRVTTRARDRYRRVIANVSVQGQDIGRWLVEGGKAYTSHWRGRNGPYEREERAARAARRGLWQAAAPIEPRIFRRQHGSCH